MSNMAPGDSVTRTVNIYNSGNLAFRTYYLSTSSDGAATALWSDATNGLQLRVRRGSAVLYDGPINVSSRDMQMALGPGGVDTLEITVSLPATAPNSMQALSQSVTFTWTAVSQ